MLSEDGFSRNNFKSMLRQNVGGRQAAADLWKVNSTTIPGVVYDVQVVITSGVLFAGCSCKAGKHSKGCKHALWVVHQINGSPWLRYFLECHSMGITPKYFPRGHAQHHANCLTCRERSAAASAQMGVAA